MARFPEQVSFEKMPPVCIHLTIAKQAAGLLHHPLIDQNLGSYLVASTLPDVHIIASDSSREETHFFCLEEEHAESGAKVIFDTYPSLAREEQLDAATRSFIAGYLSHLVTDEVWILDIYRPFFGPSSPLGGNPTANLLDRVLQFELDRRERENRAAMEEIRGLICDWEPRVRVDFVDLATVRQWRDFVCTAAIREPNLALFPFFARRFLLPRHNLHPEHLDEFLAALPAKLEWAIQYVTPERLTAFREKSLSWSVAVAREYLGEDC